MYLSLFILQSVLPSRFVGYISNMFGIFECHPYFCCAIILGCSFIQYVCGKWSTTKDGDPWSCSRAPTRAQQPWKVEMRSWWTKTRPWCWFESYLQAGRYTDTSYMLAYIHTYILHAYISKAKDWSLESFRSYHITLTHQRCTLQLGSIPNRWDEASLASRAREAPGASPNTVGASPKKTGGSCLTVATLRER